MRLIFRNQQRDCHLNRPFLKTILQDALRSEFAEFAGEICFHWVSKRKITKLNWEYLRHKGPTDVITFDLTERIDPPFFLAECFICPALAKDQAADFGTTWQDEMLRYHIHGLLHLKGFNDQKDDDRKKFQYEEERIMKCLRQQFVIDHLAKI